MKQGKTLQELALELERQAQNRYDYLADTRTIRLRVIKNEESRLMLLGDSPQLFRVNDLTHRQIGDRLGIPAKYYEKMRSENPELLEQNVNSWFNLQPERRLIRTLDGNARAFLSDRYRRLDNMELMDTVLPTISEMPGAEVISCELTETKLYLKVVNRRLEMDVKPGDTVQAGFVLSNSEVGAGSVRVEPLIFRLVCLNGLILQDYSQKRYHVGRSLEAGENWEVFRDETLMADDRAFFMKVQDTLRMVVDQAKFTHLVARLQESVYKSIGDNPIKAVETLGQRYQLTQDERSGILTHLIQGGDLSAYGLLNAVTRASQQISDYDRATELERLGGVIMTMPSKEWKEIAKAA